MYCIERFIAKEIADIAVPAFFLISGYLFFQNYKPDMLLRKWKSRVFSLCIPYFIWNGIAYLYYAVICMVPGIKSSINNPVNGFSFLDLLREMALGEHNLVTWFLRCLVVYTIVTPLIYWIIKNKYGAILTMIAVLVAITFVNKQVLNCWIFYLAGACLGIHGKTFMTAKFSKPVVICAFAYLILTGIVSMFFDTMQITVFSLLRLSQVIAIWICADFTADPEEPKWWFKISFFIYLSHVLVLESIEKTFLLLIGRSTVGAAIDFFAAPVLTLLILIALAYVLKKIKPLWFVLTGGRG